MSKVNIKRLDSVTNNDTTATALINDNFLAIQEAIENTLSRDGTTPNFMDADLDMNSYRIINSSDPTEDNDIVNLKWVKENIGGASQFAADAAASAAKATTSAQQAAVSAANSLTIYNNVTAAVGGFDDKVSEATQEFTTLADEKITNVEVAVEGFDTNAEEKLNSFNTNAAEKQSQVDASAESAAESANIALEAAEKASFGNIGDIKYTTRTDVPNGGAWCDGAEYTKAAFPDIYQMLVDGKLQKTDYETFNSSVSTNGSCGFFGLDTTSEKFKVPLLKDVYVKAGDTPLAFGKESLPNITGTSPSIGDENDNSAVKYTGSLSLKNDGSSTRLASLSQNNYPNYTQFDASVSSPTYQDGAKVNPDHVVYRAYVVLYSSAAEASVAQAAEFMTALGGKANTDLSNIPSNIDYVVESYQNSTYWYRIYKSGWVEQGATDVYSNGTTVNFMKNYSSVPLVLISNSNNTTNFAYTKRDEITTSGFPFISNTSAMAICWYACGQGE